MMGYRNEPVTLVENKVILGIDNHNLTAEHWKKIPLWLDSPAMVFDWDTVPGRLVFLAPKQLKGMPREMIVEPEKKEMSPP